MPIINLKYFRMKIQQFLYFSYGILILVSCNKSEVFEDEKVEGDYSKTIERIYSDTFEANLIDKAEKYYPPREDVLEMVWEGVEIPETDYWHYDQFDGVALPILITREAISYYSAFIDSLNANSGENFFLSANFEYKAEVAYYDTYTPPDQNAEGNPVETEDFNSVYVVHLQLKWSDYCGSLCALWINKERFVVFDKSGNLIKVFLDGVAPVLVS
jgi:hypothetical protein